MQALVRGIAGAASAARAGRLAARRAPSALRPFPFPSKRLISSSAVAAAAAPAFSARGISTRGAARRAAATADAAEDEENEEEEYQEEDEAVHVEELRGAGVEDERREWERAAHGVRRSETRRWEQGAGRPASPSTVRGLFLLGRPDEALALLEARARRGEATPQQLTCALAGLRDAGRGAEARALLERAAAGGSGLPEAHPVHFAVVAWGLLAADRAGAGAGPATAERYDAALSACRDLALHRLCGAAGRARLVAEMERLADEALYARAASGRAVQPLLELYGALGRPDEALVSGAADGGHWEAGAGWWRLMFQLGVEPDGVAWNAYLKLCLACAGEAAAEFGPELAAAGLPRDAAGLARLVRAEAEARGQPFSAVAYGTLVRPARFPPARQAAADAPAQVSFFVGQGARAEALHWLREARAARLAGGFTYGPLLAEARRTQDGPAAAALLEAMEEDGVELTPDLALPALRAFELAGMHEEALQAVGRLLEGGARHPIKPSHLVPSSGRFGRRARRAGRGGRGRSCSTRRPAAGAAGRRAGPGLSPAALAAGWRRWGRAGARGGGAGAAGRARRLGAAPLRGAALALAAAWAAPAGPSPTPSALPSTPPPTAASRPPPLLLEGAGVAGAGGGAGSGGRRRGCWPRPPADLRAAWVDSLRALAGPAPPLAAAASAPPAPRAAASPAPPLRRRRQRGRRRQLGRPRAVRQRRGPAGPRSTPPRAAAASAAAEGPERARAAPPRLPRRQRRPPFPAAAAAAAAGAPSAPPRAPPTAPTPAPSPPSVRRAAPAAHMAPPDGPCSGTAGGEGRVEEAARALEGPRAPPPRPSTPPPSPPVPPPPSTPPGPAPHFPRPVSPAQPVRAQGEPERRAALAAAERLADRAVRAGPAAPLPPPRPRGAVRGAGAPRGGLRARAALPRAGAPAAAGPYAAVIAACAARSPPDFAAGRAAWRLLRAQRIAPDEATARAMRALCLAPAPAPAPPTLAPTQASAPEQQQQQQQTQQTQQEQARASPGAARSGSPPERRAELEAERPARAAVRPQRVAAAM
eukprot:tig00001604_g9409.t1